MNERFEEAGKRARDRERERDWWKQKLDDVMNDEKHTSTTKARPAETPPKLRQPNIPTKPPPDHPEHTTTKTPPEHSNTTSRKHQYQSTTRKRSPENTSPKTPAAHHNTKRVLRCCIRRRHDGRGDRFSGWTLSLSGFTGAKMSFGGHHGSSFQTYDLQPQDKCKYQMS